MNVGEWRFVVIFNLFSKVSGCDKIAEFICECPQFFDIFERHFLKVHFWIFDIFLFLLSDFKSAFCKIESENKSSHILLRFPKFLLRLAMDLQLNDFLRPCGWKSAQDFCWPLTWNFDSVQWDWGLPWWAMDVLVHHPSPAEMFRFYRAVFFSFSFRFRCLFGNDCFIEIYLHHVEHGWIMRDTQVFQGLHLQFTILAYYIPNPGL